MASQYTKDNLIADLMNLGVPIFNVDDIQNSDPQEKSAGRFSDVYKAHHLSTGRIIAVKIVNPIALSSLGIVEEVDGCITYKRMKKTFEYFRRECGIGWSLDRRNAAKENNIVPLYGILAQVRESALPALVMEYVQGGRIIDFCKKNKSTISEKLKLLSDAANALRFLHSKGIVHRDIRPQNILVESIPPSRNKALLADFGSSKIFSVDDVTGLTIEETSTNTSDARYGPPEYQDALTSSGFHEDEKGYGDIWSLACVAIELLCDEKPWGKSSGFAFRMALIRGEAPPIPPRDFITADISSFLRDCLKTVPEDRLEVEEVYVGLRRLAETHQ